MELTLAPASFLFEGEAFVKIRILDIIAVPLVKQETRHSIGKIPLVHVSAPKAH